MFFIISGHDLGWAFASVNPTNAGIVQSNYTNNLKKTRSDAQKTFNQISLGKTIMHETIPQEVDRLIKQIKSYNDTSFNPDPHILTAVSNILISILCGKEYDPENDKIKNATRCIFNVFRRHSSILFIPFSRFIPTVNKELAKMKLAHDAVIDILKAQVEKHLLDHKI